MYNDLVELINSEPNWRDILSNQPFNLVIKEKGDDVLLFYSPLTDFSYKICKQARGIILSKFGDGYYHVVCRPFDKFFNFGEQYADDIDWSSARIYEKIDGSLIKLYFNHGTWNIATNKNIYAEEAPLLNSSNKYKTYADLFVEVEHLIDYSKLNPEYTYMFELVSPYNRIIVPYKYIDLYHLATRHNETGIEVEVDIGVKKPREYKISNINEIFDFLRFYEKLDFEGFVVKDKYNRRVKLKTYKYVKYHYLKTNISIKRILEIIKSGEEEEFLSYFPEYCQIFVDIKQRILDSMQLIINDYNYFVNCLNSGMTRKDIAKEVLKRRYSSLIFNMIDGKLMFTNLIEFMINVDILKYIDFSDIDLIA